MAKTLLLAATDPNITYLLRRYAEESGFRVVHTSEVKDILPLVEQTKPAVIILEIGLPGMIDWNVLHSLKAQEITRNVPVVIYSWLNGVEDEQVEGVAGYLRNSVLYKDFLAAMENAGVL